MTSLRDSRSKQESVQEMADFLFVGHCRRPRPSLHFSLLSVCAPAFVLYELWLWKATLPVAVG